ncbi:hypothetical protein [Sulfurovum sp.]|jgi:hypothetical protein|uniref:hypothetical protein n=1 Tax=Sulfurovum sp. TaxID=1969726 RepID=UPI002A369FD8|nr:hypothetical protein [Sulfurovum sp.]MDY0403966.1 hypothetical protein [Sulfurovum sp.]
MKIDNLLLTGLTMLVGGIIWYFRIISHPKGSKSYCVEPGCTYLGIIFITIGISIIGYKIYKWQTEKKG